MNTSFLTVLQEIIKSQGEEILTNPLRVKGFLSYMAHNEPKAEHQIFVRCLEAGFYHELKNTPSFDDRRQLKITLAQRLHNDEGLDSVLCANTLDLLEAAVFGGQAAPAKPQMPDTSG